MASKSNVRTLAHEMMDRMSPGRVRTLLELLDEDFFTPEEIAELQELSSSDEWTDWRELRSDV